MARPQDSATRLIESELNKLLGSLEAILQADCLAFVGSLHFRADDLVRDAVIGRPSKRDSLAIILETDGGYAEVVERIVRVFRKHYPNRVDFVVPNYAMSAGTVLVMSGDAIYMDDYSVLGPIDPQVPRKDGNGMVPALGYLAEYNRLIRKSKKGSLTTAEMAFLVEKFDPAELHDYKQARELSISLLKEWLVQYKFRNWVTTETRKLPVTPEMKTDRARKIAEALNETTRWHSHGRGIPMAVVREELNLRIEDISERNELSNALASYHRLLRNYMDKVGSEFVLHTPENYLSVPH